MNRLKSALGSLVVVAAVLTVAERAAEGKQGASCPRAKLEQKFRGIEYVCTAEIKSNRKSKTKPRLTWQRQITSPARKITSTTTSTVPTNPPVLGAEVELGQWKRHRPTSAEAKNQACDKPGALARLANGTSVVCVEKYGDKRWAIGPDATSLESHRKIVAWLERVLPTLPKSAKPVSMNVESSFRESDAALIKKVVEETQGFYASFGLDFAFILSTTASHFYNSARSALGTRYDNASTAQRDQWEFKWRQSKMENFVGGGHLGISPDLSVIAIKSNFTNSALAPAESQRRVVEDFVREYLTEVPRLEILYHVDGPSYPKQCWLLESTAWSLTLAVMEHFKIPNFTFSEAWAYWVSDLADYDGTYKFGLAASEKSESVANGNPRYDMPCQLAPGVGHIQGMLARELLLNKSDMTTFEKFVATDQSRQSFSGTFGFSYDSWILEADARTEKLLQQYGKAPAFVDIKTLSTVPQNAAEAQALEDVAILLADLKTTAPPGGFASAHEFFLSFTAARDRTQSGPRKVYEIVRDPLALSASLLRSANARACVLVAFDPLTKIATAYPAGMYSSKVESNATIPPNRRCD